MFTKLLEKMKEIHQFAPLWFLLFLSKWGGVTSNKSDTFFWKCVTSKFNSDYIQCDVFNIKFGTCVQKNIVSIPINAQNDGSGGIECSSNFPVGISLQGYQLDDFTKTKFIRRLETTVGTFRFTARLALDSMKASTMVKVFLLDNPEEHVTFFIFRPGGKLFSANLKPEPFLRQHNYTSAPLLMTHMTLDLPCIPNDPKVWPVLQSPFGVQSLNTSFYYEVGPRDFTPVIEILPNSYPLDHSFFFYDFTGKYTCKAENNLTGSLEETVEFEVQLPPEIIFEPQTEKVYLFKGSDLQIECKTYKSLGGLCLKGLFRGEVVDTDPRIKYDYRRVSLAGPKYLARNANVGDSGRIECRAGGQVLKTWIIKTLDIRNNAILQINTLPNNKIICQSSIFPISSMTLRQTFCQGEVECKLNEFCLTEKERIRSIYNKSSCEAITNSKFCSGANQTASLCLGLPQEMSDGLLSQGMIRCSAGAYSYTAKYFVGFDGKFYTDWTEAPSDALIELSVPNRTLYANNVYTFGCKATRFFSDGKLEWALRGRDGIEIALLDGFEEGITDVRGVYASELDYKLYTVRESKIRILDSSEYEIICKVPMWNSTKWAWTKKHIIIEVTENKFPILEIVIACVCVPITICLMGIICYIIWRRRRAKERRDLTEEDTSGLLS